MAIRDLIPWNRQENRLPVPISAQQGATVTMITTRCFLFTGR